MGGFTNSTFKADGVTVSNTNITPSNSSPIQCIGQWEVHTYGVWSAHLAIQRSTDGGNTWQTIRTVQSRATETWTLRGRQCSWGFIKSW